MRREALAGRVGVLAGGRIVALGPPAELGRSADEATVSWQAPDGMKSVQTSKPTQCVIQLAMSHDGEVPGLQVTRPSLEDRYLELIAAAEQAATEIGAAR